MMTHSALYAKKNCFIPIGRKSARVSYANIDGMLRYISYGKISTMESRPIEIKLLFHY
jgi:pyruvate formate lyase activating enzyme